MIDDWFRNAARFTRFAPSAHLPHQGEGPGGGIPSPRFTLSISVIPRGAAQRASGGPRLAAWSSGRAGGGRTTSRVDEVPRIAALPRPWDDGGGWGGGSSPLMGEVAGRVSGQTEWVIGVGWQNAARFTPSAPSGHLPHQGEGPGGAFPPHSVGRWIAREGETVGWRRRRQARLLATLGPIDPALCAGPLPHFVGKKNRLPASPRPGRRDPQGR